MPTQTEMSTSSCPHEAAQPGMCAKLLRCLYGTRDAPSRWEALFTETLESLGFERGKASTCCFLHRERGLRCVVHGDDFTFTGLDGDLDWVQAQMEKHFLCKVNGRLGGDSADLREVRLLNRVIRWGPAGIRYEADPRHTEQLVRDLELLGEPSVRSPLTSPGLKRTPESVASATSLPLSPRTGSSSTEP